MEIKKIEKKGVFFARPAKGGYRDSGSSRPWFARPFSRRKTAFDASIIRLFILVEVILQKKFGISFNENFRLTKPKTKHKKIPHENLRNTEKTALFSSKN